MSKVVGYAIVGLVVVVVLVLLGSLLAGNLSYISVDGNENQIVVEQRQTNVSEGTFDPGNILAGVALVVGIVVVFWIFAQVGQLGWE